MMRKMVVVLVLALAVVAAFAAPVYACGGNGLPCPTGGVVVGGGK